MPTRTVKGTVNEGAKTVMLRGETPLPGWKVFSVTKYDGLRWEFDGVPGDSRVRITCTRFPRPERRKLLARGHSFESVDSVIDAGEVDPASFPGDYGYKIELIAPDGTPTELRCVWPDGTDVGMGGGEKSGRPEG
jgi:hypothetical protein